MTVLGMELRWYDIVSGQDFRYMAHFDAFIGLRWEAHSFGSMHSKYDQIRYCI